MACLILANRRVRPPLRFGHISGFVQIIALHPSFPESPYSELLPEQRRFPADDTLRATSYGKLLPPVTCAERSAHGTARAFSPRMRIPVSLVLVLVLALPGCDRDSGKTPDELLAEDTTLAMDLARVNDALNDGEPDTAIGLTDDVPVPEATSDASEARNARDADLRAEAPQRAEAP
ncbi:MAG: hypothetical protein M3403_05125, partial [Gemmatimonadota bacterium]|nr:hypothetical protein [Gemmatimonadota bacterium]